MSTFWFLCLIGRLWPGSISSFPKFPIWFLLAESKFGLVQKEESLPIWGLICKRRIVMPFFAWRQKVGLDNLLKSFLILGTNSYLLCKSENALLLWRVKQGCLKIDAGSTGCLATADKDGKATSLSQEPESNFLQVVDFVFSLHNGHLHLYSWVVPEATSLLKTKASLLEKMEEQVGRDLQWCSNPRWVQQ